MAVKIEYLAFWLLKFVLLYYCSSKYNKIKYVDSFHISNQLSNLSLLTIFDMSLSFIPFLGKFLAFQPKNSCEHGLVQRFILFDSVFYYEVNLVKFTLFDMVNFITQEKSQIR